MWKFFIIFVNGGRISFGRGIEVDKLMVFMKKRVNVNYFLNNEKEIIIDLFFYLIFLKIFECGDGVKYYDSCEFFLK